MQVQGYNTQSGFVVTSQGADVKFFENEQSAIDYYQDQDDT